MAISVFSTSVAVFLIRRLFLISLQETISPRLDTEQPFLFCFVLFTKKKEKKRKV